MQMWLPCVPQYAGKINLLKDAADAIEDLENKLNLWRQDKVPRWIPVAERLPEVHQEVLVYLWGSQPYIASIDQDGVWETNDFYIDIEDTPKAWMPLPEQPKEET
jgi:hypothetical protein